MFNSEVLDGVNMILSVNGTALGASSTCSVEITRAERTTSNKDTGIWDTFAPGNMSWTMSSENFVDFGGENNFAEMYDFMTAGTLVDVACEYAQDETNTFTLTGKAFISSLPLTAPKGDNISFSVSFRGSGELTKTVVEGV